LDKEIPGGRDAAASLGRLFIFGLFLLNYMKVYA
jgi:hypothetical protein